ncbi:4595_t:CDS:2 [Entrophospora sp. SA101]|nr:4595_t:CDS:2 [Entrophospora sp. SA101]CAJ0867136.1 4732_t:CDS:2 [Entrophospora sp. SA101]CAJ0919571.1 5917_t:CDS:2 [Entrophospora sp. SA101]
MSKPRDVLFKEANLELIIPNAIIESLEEKFENIYNSKPRIQTYYDELLDFLIIVTLPIDAGFKTKSEALEYFQEMDVLLEASIIDSSTLSAPIPNPPAVYRLPPNKSNTNSNATSPSTPGTPLPPPMDKKVNKPYEGAIIYSGQYNLKSKDYKFLVIKRNDCWTCILPLTIPVAYVKTRAQSPAVALNLALILKPDSFTKETGKGLDGNLSPIENFEMINLFSGLIDDPSFEASHKDLSIPISKLYYNEPKLNGTNQSSSASQHSRRNIRKVLAVKSALNVRMRTTSVSPLDNTLMMSVELDNNTDARSGFLVESVQVNITQGYVSRFKTGLNDDKFSPQYCPAPNPRTSSHSRNNSVASVYSNSSSNYQPVEEPQPCHVSIFVKGSPIIDSVKSKSIESRWNCTLDLSNMKRQDHNSVPPTQTPNYQYQRKMSMNSKVGQIMSPNSTKSATIFSPPGSVTPTTLKTFYSGMEPTNAHNKNNKSTSDTDSMNINYGARTSSIAKSMEMDVGNVTSKAVVGKTFTIHVFIVNRSNHVRRFNIMIPNKKRSNEVVTRSFSPKIAKIANSSETLMNGNNVNGDNVNGQIEAYMEESETPDADIVCLENNVKIGPLNPSTCESVTLHFIAIKEKLHTVELVQLVDIDTGFIKNLRNVLEVYVAKPTNIAKREKRDSGIVTNTELPAKE